MNLLHRRAWIPVLFFAGSLAACSVKAQNSAGTNSRSVTLDYFFNNERRKVASGNTVRFHYTWEDKTNSGFSMWGDDFVQQGATLHALETAPTAENLRNTDVYIIVDPDTEKETPTPNYIQQDHINVIKDWVIAGGVLVLMANDSGNTEFKHFNELASTFGMRFNEDRYNLVFNNQYEQGGLEVPANHPLLPNIKKIFIKELTTLQLEAPAHPFFVDSGHVIMATAKIGKGTVLAIGDPWVYNEYIDGKRLPASFENPQAAEALAGWLLEQVPAKKKKK